MKNRKLFPLLAVAAAGLVYGFVIYFRTRYLHSQGKPVYWLEELWAPTGFLSLFLVMSAERLVGREEKKSSAKKKGKTKGAARAAEARRS